MYSFPMRLPRAGCSALLGGRLCFFLPPGGIFVSNSAEKQTLYAESVSKQPVVSRAAGYGRYTRP